MEKPAPGVVVRHAFGLAQPVGGPSAGCPRLGVPAAMQQVGVVDPRTAPRKGADPTVFVTRPISAFLLLLAVAALMVAALPAVRRACEVVFTDEG